MLATPQEEKQACGKFESVENDSNQSETAEVLRHVINGFVEQEVVPQSQEGMQFWEERLGSPKFVLAPMVDASELAWRLLSRRHGAQLCYTPMLHSSVFARDPKYRKEALASSPEDRPLIVQFCANEVSVLIEAAALVHGHCDAVDINLGCPQAIARRGHYGAFLQDEWDLLKKMVGALRWTISVPVTCKIRVFDDMKRTVEYARMLEAAGCQMLTVHGRTREQKGPLTGLAKWDYIRAVRENVNIPVIANGNIQCLQDAIRCIEETGVKAVMSAEGNLYNPAIFEGANPPAWEIALEYLDLAEKYPCPLSYARGHLFKLFHHCLCLSENFDLRTELAVGSDMSEFRRTVMQLKERYLPYHEGEKVWEGDSGYDLHLPPWVCQPYVRIAPEEHLKKMILIQNRNADIQSEDDVDFINYKRLRSETEESKNMSKKRMKKLRKLKHKPNKVFHARQNVEKCLDCPNPLGSKCENRLCRLCCKALCYAEKKDCPGHRIHVKTRLEKAMQMAEAKSSDSINESHDKVITEWNIV